MASAITPTMTEIKHSVTLGAVLVVGGSGFLGRRILLAILDSNKTSRVSAVDVKTKNNPIPSVTYHNADISSADDVRSVFQAVRPGAVIHTASPTASSHDLSIFKNIDVGGTRNLLQASKDIQSVKAFVYTSSASVVHDSVGDLFDGDDTLPIFFKPLQKSDYSHTKTMAERSSFCRQTVKTQTCSRYPCDFPASSEKTMR